MIQNQRFHNVDALRGLASLAVCWFHLTNGNVDFLPESTLKLSGAYGWLGVEVFFVISGFIIPYALWQSGYQLSHYFRFLYKRIVRLDPPYIVSLAVVISLAYLSYISPGFRGEKPDYSYMQILLHLGYLNMFFDYPWINIIYWTLAIEFQYYLLIGLIFPLLIARKTWVRWGTYILLGMLSLLIPKGTFVFNWIFLFLAGVNVFQYKCGFINRPTFLVSLCLLSCGLWYTHGVLILFVGVFTALAVAFIAVRNSFMSFLGKISYSLYLIHAPIGGRVVNLSMRYIDSYVGKLFTLAIALSMSIMSAYLLYRIIEKPAQEWSRGIKYVSHMRNPFYIAKVKHKSAGV